MMRFFLFFLFPLTLLCSETLIPIFHPPSGWECAFPENRSPCIQIGFLGKGSGSFRPSLNLAIEEIDKTLAQYVKAVKEIHLAEKGVVWRDLGKFMTLSGEGRLTEIEKTSPFGSIKIQQMIFVSGERAYILTGAAMKSDFLTIQETFLKTFQSLQLTSNLFSPLPLEKKKKFERFFSEVAGPQMGKSEKEDKWSDLQKLVSEEASHMGTYWQFLVLRAGREKIYR
jgi:hypothetical protein